MAMERKCERATRGQPDKSMKNRFLINFVDLRSAINGKKIICALGIAGYLLQYVHSDLLLNKCVHCVSSVFCLFVGLVERFCDLAAANEHRQITIVSEKLKQTMPKHKQHKQTANERIAEKKKNSTYKKRTQRL